MKDLIRMNQLAGIITEGQARKMMRILNEENMNNSLEDYWAEWAAGEVEVGNDDVINAGGVNADLQNIPSETMDTFKNYVKAVKMLNATSKELRDDIAAAISGILFGSDDYEYYGFKFLTLDQFEKIKHNLFPSLYKDKF